METDRFELFVSMTNSAMRSIHRIKVQKMKKYGLSSAHTNCLCRLEKALGCGLTQMEIVRQEMMDASQISRVLRELMERGLVLQDGEAGKYRRRYHLTEAGLAIAREIRGIIREINEYVSRDIPEEDIEVFYRTLERIGNSLGRSEAVFLLNEE